MRRYMNYDVSLKTELIFERSKVAQKARADHSVSIQNTPTNAVRIAKYGLRCKAGVLCSFRWAAIHTSWEESTSVGSPDTKASTHSATPRDQWYTLYCCGSPQIFVVCWVKRIHCNVILFVIVIELNLIIIVRSRFSSNIYILTLNKDWRSYLSISRSDTNGRVFSLDCHSPSWELFTTSTFGYNS